MVWSLNPYPVYFMPDQKHLTQRFGYKSQYMRIYPNPAKPELNIEY